jgi:prepilin peptidase CpaA
MSIDHIFLMATIAACAVGALVDARTGRIPNWLTVGLLSFALLSHAALAFHRDGGIRASLLAMGICLVGAAGSALLPVLLLRVGGLGMGDVKLFAGIGASCGALVGLYAQTYAYVVALPYALVVVMRQRKLAATLANLRNVLSQWRSTSVSPRHEGFTEVRFGPAIFAGMCIAAWARWSAS